MDTETKRQMARALLGLFCVMAAGVAGYMVIENWDFLSSLYMTVITLSTIGYGETHPLSDTGRIFTICLILGGIGMAAYAFSTLTALVLHGQLSNAIRRRKMEKEIGKLRGHYIICGATHTGRIVADELAKTGRPFLFVEQDHARAGALVEKGFTVLCEDPAEEDALAKAGVAHAAGIFCCMDSDKDNAFVAMAANASNPQARIVSRQFSDNVRHKLVRCGADTVVNPDYIGGLRMVSEMVRPATVTFLDTMMRDTKSAYRFEDVEVKKAGLLLSELRQGEAAIVAVKAANGTYTINPPLDTTLSPGEKLVALGTPQQIAELARRAE